jgi:hypothetical protein
VSSKAIRIPTSRAAAISAVPIAFGSFVVAATRGVMQVVELADRGDAGEQHLAVHGAGEGVYESGVKRRGDGVHLLAPRPETCRARSASRPRSARWNA